MTFSKILLFGLVVFSLAVISWDYTCGHSFEDLINLEYCPFCDSFQSVEIGVLIVYILILLGLVPLIGTFAISAYSFIPSFCIAFIIPNRAPPASL